jgi:ferredoxin
MAMRINQELCIQCDACRTDCPNSGITEFDAVYMIDPTRCTECLWSHDQPRCADVCPVNAVEHDPAHHEDPEVLVTKVARLSPGVVPMD